MSEPHPSPFPTALVLDTSFLRTVEGTGTDPYETFVQYVRTKDRELYLSRGVVEELTEQRGYISIDWVDRADTTEWITLVGDSSQEFGSTMDRGLAKSWIEFTSGLQRSNRRTRTSYERRTRNCQQSG